MTRTTKNKQTYSNNIKSVEEMKLENKKIRFLTIQQFIELVGENIISQATVYSLIYRKKIPIVKIGGKIAIPMKWIEEKYGDYIDD